MGIIRELSFLVFLAAVGLHCLKCRLSLQQRRRGVTLVVRQGLLISFPVAAPTACRLPVKVAHGLSSCGSQQTELL